MLRSVVLAMALFAGCEARTRWHELSGYTFERYAAEFNRNYKLDSAEWKEREALFMTRLESIVAHNNDKSKTYKLGINQFTDRTHEEINTKKGLDKGAVVRSGDQKRGLPDNYAPVSLPDDLDWRDEGVVTDVKNQGSCGSCWTFGGTEVLESHVAIATGSLQVFSEQQYVACAENPNNCGGTGGCEGGTAEIVFETAMEMGITLESSYPYLATDSECDMSKVVPVANVTGQVLLPRNEYEPLMWAVATQGPIAISVDAGWSGYEEGVFAAADGGTTIDHAVVLVGYGHDSELEMDYWLVRNSWGTDWGEEGYIRLERTADGQPCGMDEDNSMGVGCDGDPDTIEVCGTSAILYDTSYPTGAYLIENTIVQA